MKWEISAVLIIQVWLFRSAECDGCNGWLLNNTVPCNEQKVESYLDEVLKNVTSQMSDPIKLPNRNGLVKLHDGELWGFPKLKRDGSAQIVCNDNRLIITALLKVDEVAGRYHWYRKVITREFKGLIFITAKNFEVKIQVSQGFDTGDYLNLEKFEITRIEGIDVEITGLDYVTWAVSKLLDPVVEFFKRSTASVVSRPIREALARELSLIRIPTEEIPAKCDS